MKIAILGAGAVGQLTAHQLAAAMAPKMSGHISDQIPAAPMLLGRGACAQTDLFHFIALDGGESSASFDCFPLAEIELLIVTVKAYQVVDAIKALLPQLADDCHILLLHNGLGPHEQVAGMIAARGLSLGTTSQGALKQGGNSLRQTGSGISQFGHVQGPRLDDKLKQLLLAAIPASEWVDDILPALWHKLAVNACINPLTARDNVANGELAAERYAGTINSVINELLDIASKEGIALNASALHERVMAVIRLTAANSSSMRQDVTHHRKTEIDAINGYLVTLARRHGIAAPTNSALYQAIKTIEATYLPPLTQP